MDCPDCEIHHSAENCRRYKLTAIRLNHSPVSRSGGPWSVVYDTETNTYTSPYAENEDWDEVIRNPSGFTWYKVPPYMTIDPYVS